MITKENLAGRRYVAVIDQSGSMGEPASKGSHQSRWNYAKESTIALARKCEELGGSLDVYTFNSSYKHYPAAGVAKISEIFKEQEPIGGTNFVPVLTDVFSEHFKANKPTTVIIVTDGEPSDGSPGQKALERLIIETTKKMEGDGELGLEFIQVGNDPVATKFLQHLDDDLQGQGAKFDIVDTKTVDEVEKVGLEAVLLAAVND